MTQNELIEKVAAMLPPEYNTKTAVNTVYEAIRKVILGELQADGAITMRGLGVFKVVDSPERKGRNPRTGEELTIPACRKVKFTAAESVKKALNG